MKALRETAAYADRTDIQPVILNRSEENAELVDYIQTGDILKIRLIINHLEKDNYRIFLKGKLLTVILSEEKEISKPMYLHNLSVKHLNTIRYDVMKSIEVWLPGDNFFLVTHFFMPEDQFLCIYLNRLSQS